MRNPVKDKLARGEVVASMTVRLVSGVEIVRMAKSAGFDSIYIDLEHSAFSIETTSHPSRVPSSRLRHIASFGAATIHTSPSRTR